MPLLPFFKKNAHKFGVAALIRETVDVKVWAVECLFGLLHCLGPYCISFLFIFLVDPPMTQCIATDQFVRALIDFSGNAGDELSFRVGDVIHVLGRPAAGEVDDGWIEGEMVPAQGGSSLAPPARGVFPSMFVEAVEAVEEAWRCRLDAAKRPRKNAFLMFFNCSFYSSINTNHV